LIDLLIDANVGIADYQAKILLGDRYFRKNLVLGEKIEMDEWKKIPKLIQAAKSAKIDDAANWMKENWR
jgi:hypothetical protein